MISVNSFFGLHKFNCICGKIHNLPVREIIIDKNISNIISNSKIKLGSKGIVVIESIINKLIGTKIVNALGNCGYDVKLLLFNNSHIIPNKEAVKKIINELGNDTDFLVAAGSGTINDIVKYASFKARKPYISIPTSPSVDGYAANVSLLMINNFKRTFYVNPPIAIYADIEILKTAPKIYIVAGIGDLIAKLTAQADWLISSIINGEYYCKFITVLIQEGISRCIKNMKKILSKDDGGIKILIEGLILSGIAMHWVNSSRPVAGAEHHISHFWEMKALQEKTEHYKVGSYPHGIKVGIGTLIMSKIYEKLLLFNQGKINFSNFNKRLYGKKKWELEIRRVYGPVADEVIVENDGRDFSKEYCIKQANNIVQKAEEWKNGVKSILPESENLKRWLLNAGIPLDFSEMGFSKETLRESILYSKDIRKKFTVLDVANYLGLLEKFADEVAGELINKV